MRDTEFSILVFVSGFWSRYARCVLDALDIPEGGTLSVSITYAALFEHVTLYVPVCCSTLVEYIVHST